MKIPSASRAIREIHKRPTQLIVGAGQQLEKIFKHLELKGEIVQGICGVKIQLRVSRLSEGIGVRSEHPCCIDLDIEDERQTSVIIPVRDVVAPSVAHGNPVGCILDLDHPEPEPILEARQRNGQHGKQRCVCGR